MSKVLWALLGQVSNHFEHEKQHSQQILKNAWIGTEKEVRIIAWVRRRKRSKLTAHAHCSCAKRFRVLTASGRGRHSSAGYSLHERHHAARFFEQRSFL